MIIPIALGGAALLYILSQSSTTKEGDAKDGDATLDNGAVVYDPAAVTTLDADEYVTFNLALGTDLIPNGAVLALLPAEAEGFDPAPLADALGELGYSDLGIVTVTAEDFDPPRFRLVKRRIEEAQGDSIIDEDTWEDSIIDDTWGRLTLAWPGGPRRGPSLEEVLAEVEQMLAATREKRAAAGYRARRYKTRRGRVGGRMSRGEIASHGRGLTVDFDERFAYGLNPGERAAPGHGLIGGTHVLVGGNQHVLVGANHHVLVGNRRRKSARRRDPLDGVPLSQRPAMRRAMRQAMRRGETRNPMIAAKIVKRRGK